MSKDKKVSFLHDKALASTSNILTRADHSILEFMNLTTLPEPFDCKPGCHYCCYNLPMVTPPEVFLIGRELEQTFTEKERQVLRKKIKKILEKIDGKPGDELALMRHELPCIFLQNDKCMIYSVRPAVCRACSSTSAAHCQMIFETRNHRARLRCYQQVREIMQAAHSDLIDLCREMGCQGDVLYLADAVEDYLKHSQPLEAWLHGEMVFRIRDS